MVLVERGPGAEVVPSEIGGDAVEAGGMLALGGARLEHGIVHADVLALGIELLEGGVELLRPPAFGDLLEIGRGLREVLAQRVGERARAPDEHAGVPEIISGGDELFRLLECGLLGETLHAQNAFVFLP